MHADRWNTYFSNNTATQKVNGYHRNTERVSSGIHILSSSSLLCTLNTDHKRICFGIPKPEEDGEYLLV